MDIIVLKSIDEIIKHEKLINDTLVDQRTFYPTAHTDFYLTRISCNENILHPYCIFLYQENLIKAILLGYIEKKTEAIQLGMGYKKLFNLPVKSLHIVAGGCYLDLKTDELKFFYKYILNTLNGDFDVIQIDSFGVNYALLKLYKKNLFHNIVINKNTQCQANVSDTYDVFYKNRSKRTREELRKKEKQLYKQYDEKDVCVKVFNNINDLEIALNDIEIVASKTYQRKMSVGFLNDKETQIIYKKMASGNKLLLPVLYIEKIPRAFETGFVFNNTFYGLTKGYDPDFANLNVGYYIFISILKYLCNLENIKYYDFGIGDSYLKNRVSDRKITLFQAKIFAKSTRGYISFIISIANRILKNTVSFIKKRLGKK